jgi:glycosyltransferase involved in cell wall biosynthesis
MSSMPIWRKEGSGRSFAMRNKVILLTNIPALYRLPLFDAMSEVLSGSRDFKVCYCRNREPNRNWDARPELGKAPFEILRGFMISFRKKELFFHFNPGIVPRVLDRRLDTVILAGSWNSPTCILALLALRLFNRRVRVIFWSENHKYAVRHSKGPVALLRSMFYKVVNGFIVPGRESRDYIRSMTGRDVPVFLITNTVDEAVFAKSLPKDNARHSVSLPLDRKVIVTVAQLEARKGIPFLLDAVFPAFVNDRRVHFVLIGDGTLRPRLEQLISGHGAENITYLRRAEPAGVFAFLKAADAFLLPSLYDPNPISAIEAAFCGAWLVLSRHAGNARDLVAGGGGMVLESVTAAALREAIDAVIAMPAEAMETASKEVSGYARRVFSVSGNRKVIGEMFGIANRNNAGRISPMNGKSKGGKKPQC